MYSQPQSSSNSVAIFNVPSDGTNSLYIDGVPNDTNEREVSRTFLLKFQIYSVHFLVFNVLDWLKKPQQQEDNFSYVSLIFRMCCSQQSLWILCKITGLTKVIKEDWKSLMLSNQKK